MWAAIRHLKMCSHVCAKFLSELMRTSSCRSIRLSKRWIQSAACSTLRYFRWSWCCKTLRFRRWNWADWLWTSWKSSRKLRSLIWCLLCAKTWRVWSAKSSTAQVYSMLRRSPEWPTGSSKSWAMSSSIPPPDWVKSQNSSPISTRSNSRCCRQSSKVYGARNWRISLRSRSWAPGHNLKPIDQAWGGHGGPPLQ